MPVQRVTLRVIAVISLAIALVSQAVSFRTQPAELELSMSYQQHELTQHELPTAEPALGPRRILRTTSLLHVTSPAALHATSRTGACDSHSRVQA